MTKRAYTDNCDAPTVLASFTLRRCLKRQFVYVQAPASLKALTLKRERPLNGGGRGNAGARHDGVVVALVTFNVHKT